jgi:hypothetical protein
MKKGTVVLVKAQVIRRAVRPDGQWGLGPPLEEDAREVFCPNSGGLVTGLYAYPLVPPVVGMILGRTFRTAGHHDYVSEDEISYYFAEKYIGVWLVEPLEGERWLRPLAVLEEDLTVQD